MILSEFHRPLRGYVEESGGEAGQGGVAGGGQARREGRGEGREPTVTFPLEMGLEL